jgi:hypothetical protein
MNTKKEIELIEFKLKATFNKDRITRMDVIESNKLFEKWKQLTKHVSNKTPVLKTTSDKKSFEIIDKFPNWQIKNLENDENNKR